MKTVIRFIATVTASLLFGTVARADKPYTITQLNCVGNDGSKLSAGVYAYSFDSADRLVSIYLSGSRYSALAYEYYYGSGYSSCTLASLPGVIAGGVTVKDVTAVGVGIDVGAGAVAKDTTGQSYTEVILSFTSIPIDEAKGRSPQTATTVEQQAKALDAFKARSAQLLRR